MILEIKENILEINTSEAYNKNVFIKGDFIIIPYINNEVFIGRDFFEAHDKLDYSYLIFKGVTELFWSYSYNSSKKYGKLRFSENEPINDLCMVDYIAVSNMYSEIQVGEFKVKYKNQYLYYSDSLRIKKGSLNMWMPKKSPLFNQDIFDDEASNFFLKENIPNEILDFFEINDSNDLKILDFFGNGTD